MEYLDLPALTIEVADGVANVVIDHPPLNLLDGVLLPSLRSFVNRVRHDIDVRVIVFSSADPKFFIAHGDLRFITEPETVAAAGAAAMAAVPDAVLPAGLNLMQVVHEEVRSLPQVTIAKISGLARGGGNEFLMTLDMRFAAIGRSGQSQPEALMGIIPGGGGTQYLTGLVGPSRALELILSGELIGAEDAASYGLVNRALPAEDLDAFVNDLARRIAALRPEIVMAAKTAVYAARSGVDREGLAVENDLMTGLFTPEAAELAHKLLAAGAQTRDGEVDLEGILSRA